MVASAVAFVVPAVSAQASAPSADTEAMVGAASAGTVQMIIEMSNIPVMLSAFFADVGTALLQAEARRGLLILFLMCTVSIWMITRILWGVVNRMTKVVVVDVLKDEQVSKLMLQRFVDTLVTATGTAAFRDSYERVLWSDGSKSCFKCALAEPMMERPFVEGIASFIRGVVGTDFLVDSIRTQIRDTLADQDIHRALLKGAEEAWKPGWMKAAKPTKDKEEEPTTPVTSSRPRSLPGLLGKHTWS
jgi:hypothetical protein